MAEHKIIRLADLVAESINAANLGWQASRKIVPNFKKEDLDATLFVTVIPKAENVAAVSRQHKQADRELWLVIVKPLSQGETDTFDEDEIDTVFEEVANLEEWLEFRNMGESHWIGTATDLLYDHEHMLHHREFYGIRSVSYRSIE